MRDRARGRAGKRIRGAETWRAPTFWITKNNDRVSRTARQSDSQLVCPSVSQVESPTDRLAHRDPFLVAKRGRRERGGQREERERQEPKGQRSGPKRTKFDASSSSSSELCRSRWRGQSGEVATGSGDEGQSRAPSRTLVEERRTGGRAGSVNSERNGRQWRGRRR